jgi:hypothetical protein
MSSNLYRLYFIDHKARRTACALNIALVFSYGVVGNVVLHWRTALVVIEGAVLAVIASIIWSLFYCRTQTKQQIQSAGVRMHPRPIARVPYLVAAAVVALVCLIPLYLGAMGRTLLAISPKAWSVVKMLPDFRSFLNSSPQFVGRSVGLSKPRGPTEQLSIVSADDGSRFMVRCTRPGQLMLEALGSLPSPRAALADNIRNQPNQAPGVGPRFYLLSGQSEATLAIDEWHFRNVIFRDLRITYRGGPTRLENVYFVGCMFDISHDGNGEALARVLLHAAPTSFDAN